MEVENVYDLSRGEKYIVMSVQKGRTIVVGHNNYFDALSYARDF